MRIGLCRILGWLLSNVMSQRVCSLVAFGRWIQRGVSRRFVVSCTRKAEIWISYGLFFGGEATGLGWQLFLIGFQALIIPFKTSWGFRAHVNVILC